MTFNSLVIYVAPKSSLNHHVVDTLTKAKNPSTKKRKATIECNATDKVVMPKSSIQ